MAKRGSGSLSPIEPESGRKINIMEGETPMTKLTVNDLNNILQVQLFPFSKAIEELAASILLIKGEYADLKKEVVQMRLEKEADKKRICALEDQIKKNNVIFKGLNEQRTVKDAVSQVLTEKLQSDSTVKSVKKIYSRNGKMGVVAEFHSEEEAWDVIKNSRKLAGTSVSIEKDLNSDRQVDKRVMLQLKRDILAESKEQRITVRDDRLRIGEDLWLRWSDSKELVYGKDQEKADAAIKNLFSRPLAVNFNYNDIQGKIRKA